MCRKPGKYHFYKEEIFYLLYFTVVTQKRNQFPDPLLVASPN